MNKLYIGAIIIVSLFVAIHCSVYAELPESPVIVTHGQNGLIADFLEDNRELCITVSSKKKYDVKHLWITQYSQNGELLAIDYAKADYDANFDLEYNPYTYVIPNENTEEMRFYLWNDDVTPVYQPYILKRYKGDFKLNGDGTVVNPYQITNKNELQYIFEKPHQAYIITNDINMSDIEWIPKNFYGILNGNGHLISGLNVSTDNIYSGLIAVLGKKNVYSVIKNLNLNVRINTNASYCGSIAGEMTLLTEINNCNITGTLINNSNGYIGGIVGVCDGGSINDCNVNLNIKNNYNSDSYVGGIVGSIKGGYNNIEATVNNCIADGEIYVPPEIVNVGGIYGENNGNVVLKDCIDNMVVLK